MADFDPVETIEFFRERNRVEAATTAKVLRGIPADALSYRSHPGSSTICTTAWSRIRFHLEVVDNVSSAIGKDRLGVRLSPFGRYGGICDSNPLHLYRTAIQALDDCEIGCLHLIEGGGSDIGLADSLNEEALNNARPFRSAFRGVMISAGPQEPSTAGQVVAEGDADAIAFGRLFIANPDIVWGLKDDLPRNAYDRSTFYGGGGHGYTAYPTTVVL